MDGDGDAQSVSLTRPYMRLLSKHIETVHLFVGQNYKLTGPTPLFPFPHVFAAKTIVFRILALSDGYAGEISHNYTHARRQIVVRLGTFIAPMINSTTRRQSPILGQRIFEHSNPSHDANICYTRWITNYL